MEVALTMVRLRWALTLATLRKSTWQTIGYVLGIVFGIGALVGVGALAWFLGGPVFDMAGHHIPAGWMYGVLHVAVMYGSTFAGFIILFIQLMLVGDGSTMAPHRFALYGIPDRKLQLGMLLGGLSGLPAICGTLALMLWSLAYRWMSVGMVVMQLIAAPLAIITMMSLAKLVISASTTLVRSKRGKNAFYLIAMIVFIVLCQLPNIIDNPADSGSLYDFPSLTDLSVADALSWTPFGAAFQLPYDLLTGNPLLFVARLAILAVTWVVCFVGCVWCLRHDRVTAGAPERAAKVRGIGAFGWMPDSTSGAMSARLLTYLRRDPRQILLFVMPVLFVALFALQSRGVTIVIWQGLIWGGWMMQMTEGNGLAYDGRGFTLEVLAGVRGRDDRRSRMRVFASINVIYMVVLGLACFVLTGDWRTADGLLLGVTFICLALGVSFSSIGVAEITNCSLMYPVPSMDKPFSTPQGRAVAQGLFPFVQLFGCLIPMLPTILVAIVLVVADMGGWLWVMAPVGLANGVAAMVIGSWLGGKLLDARAIRVVQTLDSFASLQR